MTDILRTETKDGVATLTLNRPKALNALDRALLAELGEAAGRLEHDARVRCVVLRGEGDHFAAGGDVKMFYDLRHMPAGERQAKLEMLVHDAHIAFRRFRRMPKPVIASVRGAAVGGGLGLALSADMLIAGESAYFCFGYAGIGVSPDCATSYHLPRIVGPRKALAMAYTNERVGAAEAKAIGLVWKVVPDASLDTETEALARKIAAGPTRAFAATKRLMTDMPLFEAQIDAEAASFGACAASEDFVEGVAAFTEKRPAKFTGQ
jgi:2-(1,2-epoxy-1,2-dihydrophenyl)acetyl-CoA isomerase